MLDVIIFEYLIVKLVLAQKTIMSLKSLAVTPVITRSSIQQGEVEL